MLEEKIEFNRIIQQAEECIKLKNTNALEAILKDVPTESPAHNLFTIKLHILKNQIPSEDLLVIDNHPIDYWVDFAMRNQMHVPLAFFLQRNGNLSINELKAQVELGNIQFVIDLLKTLPDQIYSFEAFTSLLPNNLYHLANKNDVLINTFIKLLLKNYNNSTEHSLTLIKFIEKLITSIPDNTWDRFYASYCAYQAPKNGHQYNGQIENASPTKYMHYVYNKIADHKIKIQMINLIFQTNISDKAKIFLMSSITQITPPVLGYTDKAKHFLVPGGRGARLAFKTSIVMTPQNDLISMINYAIKNIADIYISNKLSLIRSYCTSDAHYVYRVSRCNKEHSHWADKLIQFISSGILKDYPLAEKNHPIWTVIEKNDKQLFNAFKDIFPEILTDIKLREKLYHHATGKKIKQALCLEAFKKPKGVMSQFFKSHQAPIEHSEEKAYLQNSV
ncbi:MAG: hypothetical protein SFW66_09790 [Gammaproteobacteria bacterium]|nr:hypothetical protein [Gammaproteobacteria bacterium]